MKSIKFRIFLLSILTFAGFISFSCKSSNNETAQNDLNNAVVDTIAQSNITETPEDVMTVDYKKFYDELSPHGQWIQITQEDLDDMKSGLVPKGTSSYYDDEMNSIIKDRTTNFPHYSLAQLFGVNDAVAADVDMGAFFVWRPDPALAVSIGVGNNQQSPAVVGGQTMPASYIPYTNGQWVATNEGWYFKAPTVHEEIVHHYGRWIYSPALQWVWVPGRVRSPAWVYWKEDNDMVAWTPIPPDVYVVNNTVEAVPVIDDNFVVVEKRYFVEPKIYERVYIDKIKVKGMKRIDGIIVRDRVIYNNGPSIYNIQTFANTEIKPYEVAVMNNDFRNTWIENNRVNTFAPVFTKIKTDKKRDVAVVKPEKFNKLRDVWDLDASKNPAGGKIEEHKQEGLNTPSQKEKEQKERESRKDVKDNKKSDNPKMIDDSKMKTGEKPHKEQKEDRGNKEKKVNPKKENRLEGNPNRDDKPMKEKKGKDKNDGSGKRENKEFKQPNNDKQNDKGRDKGKDDSHGKHDKKGK
jgi:hypothetical protein